MKTKNLTEGHVTSISMALMPPAVKLSCIFSKATSLFVPSSKMDVEHISGENRLFMMIRIFCAKIAN